MDTQFGIKTENWIFCLWLDKHINDGYGDQVALIYDSTPKTVKKYTLEVKTEVAKLAEGWYK
jgi:propionyl-CoA synthetase